MKKLIIITILLLLSTSLFAGPNYRGGKISSLKASGTDPAIRLVGNISPDLCSGGTYGWLYFAGTAEEKNRMYASALAFSLSGVYVTVYTNSDGATCRITNIQVTSGLN